MGPPLNFGVVVSCSAISRCLWSSGFAHFVARDTERPVSMRLEGFRAGVVCITVYKMVQQTVAVAVEV